MVVSLVLEHEQPVLGSAVDVDLDLDRAGVDLLRFVKVLELTGLFQILRAERSHVHESDILLAAAVNLAALCDIVLVGLLDVVVAEGYIVNRGREGRMAAVVGPIRIDHANFGNSRVAPLLILKIALTEHDVVKVHCERVFLEKSAQLVLAHRDKAVDSLDGRRNLEIVGERLGQLERSLAALDRIYYILLDA